jgi:hypothetical protein
VLSREDYAALAEKIPVVPTFLGQGVSFVGFEPVFNLILSASSLILLVLVMTKYRESRGMKLTLFCVLTGSASYRLVRGLMTGLEPSWLDALAAVFFGYLAIAEGIGFARNRSGRR